MYSHNTWLLFFALNNQLSFNDTFKKLMKNFPIYQCIFHFWCSSLLCVDIDFHSIISLLVKMLFKNTYCNACLSADDKAVLCLKNFVFAFILKDTFSGKVFQADSFFLQYFKDDALVSLRLCCFQWELFHIHIHIWKYIFVLHLSLCFLIITGLK